MLGIIGAIIIIGLICLVGATVLVVAAHLMQVKTDERVEAVQEALPGANCGACGYAGCADYASAVVNKGEGANLCVPGGKKTAEAVAFIMGTSPKEVGELRAVVNCCGINGKAKEEYLYTGLSTCAASNVLHGGSKACSYACLGFGDCARACTFDALHVENGVAVVDARKCTGCGACKKVCPKNIIWIREKSAKPAVLCSSQSRGAATRAACTAGCIACMKCEKICPTQAIKVAGNLARIELQKCISCNKCVEVCPVQVIFLIAG
ncbi:MAG: RnfABCDGE type electron transport complex subunit B [Oscillospiraceae bacterium]